MGIAALFTIEIDRPDPQSCVATLRLEQPGKPVVVLDADLLARLEATILALPADLTGLILASASERVFVAGADLKAIATLDDPALRAYLAKASHIYQLLASLPCPTAAAINGAALGGGLELAMHCDGLIGAPGIKPYPIGLPEAGLSICPGWGGTCLFPARLKDPALAMRLTAAGKPMLFPEAVDAGLFDAVAPDAASLISTAKAWLAKAPTPVRDGAPSRHAGRPDVRAGCEQAWKTCRLELDATEPGQAVSRCIGAGLARGWRACLETEQRELVRLRHTPPAKSAIEAFFSKGK
jgi:enoyl-CoA hydratase/carnithine racemase